MEKLDAKMVEFLLMVWMFTMHISGWCQFTEGRHLLSQRMAKPTEEELKKVYEKLTS